MAKDSLNGSRGTRRDTSDADIDRGYSDAFPTSRYENNRDGREAAMGDMAMPMSIDGCEPRRTHGMQDEYGFVERPLWRGDVGRN